MSWNVFGVLVVVLLTLRAVESSGGRLLVIGSINADTFLPVARLPQEGENLTLLPHCHPIIDVPGGKGCTQAVAASKLFENVAFCGQFGNDGSLLQDCLKSHRVQLLAACQTHKDIPSGRGYVFLTQSGSVSAVVSGGSNVEGWKAWDDTHNKHSSMTEEFVTDEQLEELLDGVDCIMLQREIPEFVNKRIAKRAQQRGGILVLQDVGGEDRPMDRDMLQACDYLIPNETELSRLVRSFQQQQDTTVDGIQDDEDAIVAQAKWLQHECGAPNVLVTRGARGSTLVTTDGRVIHQPACSVATVVDETGAGDSYRAAFAVALLEGRSLEDCMKFASAAGSCAVQVQGAVPSTPTRAQVEEKYRSLLSTGIPRGGGPLGKGKFPFLIGSRLNSMKDRPELWPAPLESPKDYVQRQATVRGLTCVDFNYPQHFQEAGWSVEEAKKTLKEAGLVAGAVCLRYPSRFARGAMTHPDWKLRREALDLTKEAAQVALDLGCDEVVVWSAYDGYDYPFQVDYDEKWNQLVRAFQECCDTYPNIRFSLEFKPTDENTRFFIVPSTGAALQLVDEINRPNMGLTLDIGHMLMAGENPAQSIAMVARKKKLFGIQLNDGYTRLAAEDGLIFGSVHESMALEIMYQLRQTGFEGHLYFDTFPQRTDPVREAEYNIQRVKAFWSAAGELNKKKLRVAMREHSAIEAIELVDEALRYLK